MHSVVFRARSQLRPYLKLSSCLPRNPYCRSSRLASTYRPSVFLDLPGLDKKWRQKWEEKKPLGPNQGGENMYVLAMFPYPSGKLHLGHLRVYTIADVVARFHTMRGRNVMLPMGWDAFGLPAENAAIERGIDPGEWTVDNMARMKEQLQLMNASFDWSRELATCDPKFYKHTQKLFLLLREHGLVSRKKASVKWDPVENTVLANEQVDADGRSWRSGAVVEQRELEQWYLHITEFKESLLRDLDKLGENDAWPERVLELQRQWLGRSEGAYYKFPVSQDNGKVRVENLEIYTTRPETIFAAQFLAISPNSQLADDLAKEDPKLRSFLDRAKILPHSSMEGYRLSQAGAINPLSLLKKTASSDIHADPLPIFVAPYVRGDYETAAVMGVPAHDARDSAFWKRHCPDVPVKYAVTRNQGGNLPKSNTSPIVAPGYMTSLADDLQGKRSQDAATEIVARIQESTQLARSTVKWKLRDWLISRQRYWGTPIPIIHCDDCGAQPVPDDQLPVELPKVGHHWADGRTENPLLAATDWINTTCPSCHGPAKRDTDTMDTFMDSSWYYMRYADPLNPDSPVSEAAAKQHLPVDIYVGGVEHAILHLLYARFMYKAAMGLLYPPQSAAAQGNADRKTLATQTDQEPFKRLITQGMVQGRTYTDPDTGRFLKPEEVDLSDPSSPKISDSGKEASVSYEKMSKSKYNGVDPGNFMARYGADATRAHILFQAPVSDHLNWDEEKIAGITKWLYRVHDLVYSLAPAAPRASWDAKQHFSQAAAAEDTPAAQRAADAEVWRTTQNTIVSVSQSMEKVWSVNTAVSDLMVLTNVLVKHAETSSEPVRAAATAQLLHLMAPITPAFAEECWGVLYPSEPGLFEFPQQQEGKKEKEIRWPTPDGTLALVQAETVKCVVMVDGRRRFEVDIPAQPPAPEALAEAGGMSRWLTEEILKDPSVQERLESSNLDIRKALNVFPKDTAYGKIVNFVMKKVR